MRLGEITHLEAGTELGTAAVSRDLPQDGLKEGGLASTVGTNERYTFAAFQDEIWAGEKRTAFIFIANLQVIGA